MDEDAGKAVVCGELEESVEVALVRVDSAVGDEAEDVESVVILCRELNRVGEDGVGEEAAVLDGGVAAGDVHVDDAPGAEVEVADLGVTHLPVGEADVVLAGADEGVGVGAEEVVVGGFTGESDGVSIGLGAVTPAVEDGEDDRFIWHSVVRISRGVVGWVAGW